jgi:hypothetical protein
MKNFNSKDDKMYDGDIVQSGIEINENYEKEL